jgi:hypothetical protein
LGELSEGPLQLVSEERGRVRPISTHHASIFLACCCARLPIRSFARGPHLRDEIEAVHGVATLEVLDALVDGGKQSGALLGVEVVADGSGRTAPEATLR